MHLTAKKGLGGGWHRNLRGVIIFFQLLNRFPSNIFNLHFLREQRTNNYPLPTISAHCHVATTLNSSLQLSFRFSQRRTMNGIEHPFFTATVYRSLTTFSLPTARYPLPTNQYVSRISSKIASIRIFTSEEGCLKWLFIKLKITVFPDAVTK